MCEAPQACFSQGLSHTLASAGARCQRAAYPAPAAWRPTQPPGSCTASMPKKSGAVSAACMDAGIVHEACRQRMVFAPAQTLPGARPRASNAAPAASPPPWPPCPASNMETGMKTACWTLSLQALRSRRVGHPPTLCPLRDQLFACHFRCCSVLHTHDISSMQSEACLGALLAQQGVKLLYPLLLDVLVLGLQRRILILHSNRLHLSVGPSFTHAMLNVMPQLDAWGGYPGNVFLTGSVVHGPEASCSQAH